MRGGRAAFAARPIWCVNSTASGGGVAELLRTMLSYVSGVGIEARWAVITGDAEFFAITKRIHNFIHGSAGDGGSLGHDERQIYDQVMAANLPGLLRLIAPQSVVLLHDPQTAGLVRPLQQHGCTVVWRSHIGALRSNAYVDEAWAFIEPYVRDADLLVFSERSYVPAILADAPTAIVAPSIDPFSPKNTELAPQTVHAIVVAAGLLAGAPPTTAPFFRRFTGQMSEVHSRVDLLDGGPAPEAGRPLVLQVSRWDRLKDHLGVLQGFAHRTLADTDADQKRFVHRFPLLLPGDDRQADIHDLPTKAEAKMYPQRNIQKSGRTETLNAAAKPHPYCNLGTTVGSFSILSRS